MSLLHEIVLRNESTTDRIMEKANQCIIISSHHGGISVKSTFENTQTQGMIKRLAGDLIALTRSCVRDIDPGDDLVFMRIMTKNFEYLVATDPEFTIVVQQNRVT